MNELEKWERILSELPWYRTEERRMAQQEIDRLTLDKQD